MFTGMAGERARAALAGTRFADVRWVAETGSTNADAARPGPRRRARGRRAGGRPPDRRPGPPRPHVGGAAGRVAAVSVLLRPAGAGRSPPPRWRSAVAAAEASRRWPASRPGSSGPTTSCGRATARRRPEAGRDPGRGRVAARADVASGRARRPDERAVVVVGIGINVNWPRRPARRPRRHRGRAQPRRRARRRPRGPARRAAAAGSTTTTGALRADGPDALLADVAGPVGHARPPGAGRPRRRRRSSGTAVDVTADGPPRGRRPTTASARSSPSATSSTSADRA